MIIKYYIYLIKIKKFLSPSETTLAKNHFRYLLANSINKKYLKLKFFYYLFLQKI